MIVSLFSDLHLEFGSSLPIDNPASELIIFSGDTDIKARAFKKIRSFYPDKPIIYINGNHEYYGSHFDKIHELSQIEAQKYHINYLHNNYLDIGSLRFFGGTMWTNFNLYNSPLAASYFAKEQLNDYRKIRVENYRRLYPEFVKRQHESFMKSLKETLSCTSQQLILITHHAPSVKSIHPNFTTDETNPAYAVNLDDFILKNNHLISHWFHGHLHHSVNYQIGSTQVLSNPHGYLLEKNPDFKSDFTIDLSLKKNQLKII